MIALYKIRREDLKKSNFENVESQALNKCSNHDGEKELIRILNKIMKESDNDEQE